MILNCRKLPFSSSFREHLKMCGLLSLLCFVAMPYDCASRLGRSCPSSCTWSDVGGLTPPEQLLAPPSHRLPGTA